MSPTRGCRLLAVTACIAVLLAAPSAAQITFPATSSDAAAAPAAAMPIAVVTVDPFSTIQVCAPVNVLIVPSNSTNYTVSGQADPGVLQSLIPVVANGTLQLQTSGNFTTNNIVSLQVALPADQLTGLILSSPASQVTLQSGFSSPNFGISAPFSSGNVYALGLDTANLSIANSGTGNVLVNGTIGSAMVSSSGTGSVYLLGVNTSVVVDLAGVSSVYLRNANRNVMIGGSSSGVNSVYYQNGICTIPSPFGFGGPCVQQPLVNVPTINPQWSCGLMVTGNFTCAGSASAGGAAVNPNAAAAASAGPSLASASGGNIPAAVATGTQTALAVGSPGQSAVASAINNGQGVPPGSPITANSNAFSTNAPAFASSVSLGRKLKQFPADFFNNFNSAFDNIASGSGNVAAISAGNQAANAVGSGNQNAFASGTNGAQAVAVSGGGNPAGIESSSQFGGRLQSIACTADPTLLNILQAT
ncbi:hypothetical protein ABBQ38_001868 [Trebouxia sp. C0009 RCD-2024]